MTKQHKPIHLSPELWQRLRHNTTTGSSSFGDVDDVIMLFYADRDCVEVVIGKNHGLRQGACGVFYDYIPFSFNEPYTFQDDETCAIIQRVVDEWEKTVAPK